MERLGTAFRQTLRRLNHEWRYAVLITLILGVGIGPTASMVSVVYNVLLRPLDYREPERLGLLRISLGQLRNHPGLSPAEAIDIRRSGVMESVEAETRLSEVSLGPPDNLVPLSQLSFTSGMLPMLGVQPILGRNFTENDFPPPPPPVPPRPAGSAAPAPVTPPPPPPPQKILLDYGAWQNRFSGDRGVVGKLVLINGRSAEVIGVLPDGFRLATGRAAPQRIDVYTGFPLRDFRNSWQFPTLVRLKRGASFAQTQAGLDAVAATLKRDHADVYQGQLQFTVSPLLDDMTRTTKPALRAAAAAVLLLFVIAFANATALVIARMKTRENDFAVRSALGATSRALIGHVVMESVVLAFAGAIVGSALAVATTAGIRAIIPRTVPRWEQIAVGWDQLGYAAGLTLVGLLVLGLVPVWRITRGANFVALRSASAQGGKAEGAVSRLILVGAQMVFTVVLAFGCVQLARSAIRLRHVDLGFDPNVLTLRVPFDFQRFPSRSARAALYQRIRDRVQQVPGVTDVGVVTHIPLSGSTMMDGYEADLSKEPSFEQAANYQAVTSGYFRTLRIPMLQGRDFTDQEDADTMPVIVVDESLVRAVFPGDRNVIGRALRLGWGLSNARIVGVVGHARTIEAGRAVRPQIYAPIGNLFQNAGIVTVRATGDVRRLESAITAAIREVGPGRAVSGVAMLTDNVTAATSTLIAITGLVTILALSAGLLSAVGLYLVIAFVIHQRRRSTAIRTALGATSARVMWDNFRTSALMMCAALPLGALVSLAAGTLLDDLVYGVSSRDALSLLAALAIAAVAGLLGTYFPVRRATSANILNVLREM